MLATPQVEDPIAHDGGAEKADDLEALIQELIDIRRDMTDAAAAPHSKLDSTQDKSARNLLHYLALRRRDVRPLQGSLAALGLSSLGRSEAHVLSCVEAVLSALHAMAGRTWSAPRQPTRVDFGEGDDLLAEHTDRLLGPASTGRATRIMVTMPTDAADDYTLVHDLLERGMNCMRVNCAHDDVDHWRRTIEHLRRAEKALGRTCRVLMDLGGPKLRTGPLAPGPGAIKIKPTRDAFGRVTAKARVWLKSKDGPDPPSRADASLPVPQKWLSALDEGDRVSFDDARGSRRTLRIVDIAPTGCWAELAKTAYVVSGTTLTRRGRHGAKKLRARVGVLPSQESAIRLCCGDVLVVTRGSEPGRPATVRRGHVLTPASIGCTLDQIFDDVRPGEAIWFDDGTIGGVIESTSDEGFRVKITHVPSGGAKLRSDKGINLPETDLHLRALTEKDLEDLAFVVEHADLVGLSFASSADDVHLLQQNIVKLGSRRPAIVLKVETERGFQHLPDMLLAAMAVPSCGVMIARGDLAVECGFERLAEVQEEILWICEAAHVPVVWATQVLENLAKDGLPSRAEITDAAMSQRAECVMLNKGPHVREAVEVLDNILHRMEGHQTKQRSTLRKLRLARGAAEDRSAH